MNKKEQYGIVLLLTAILSFQIWVAQAETQQTKEKDLSSNRLVLKAMTKIISDNDLRQHAGFASQEIAASDQAVTTAANDATNLKKNKETTEFIWYKPWTWFGK